MQNPPNSFTHSIFAAVNHLAQSAPPLTLATALITITFIIHVTILWAGTRRLKRAVSHMQAMQRAGAGSSALANAVNDFHKHLIQYGGKECRTTSADFFLPDTAMINGFLPVRHLSSVGNLMLTTGILCTFLSLTVGLESNTTIAKLTPYVGGALLSSVEGLLFSLLFSFLYSIYMERARGVVRSLVCLLDAKYELVTLEVLQVAELVQLGNIQVSLNRQSTSQEEILYPKIGGLLEASGKLRLTISQALALESTHIRDALVASLTDFESGWKKSVEETLEKWSSTFANKLNSTILVQLGQIMDRSRAVVTALADLERRIETIPQRVDEQASAILSNLTTSFREGTGAIKSGVSQLIEEFDRGTSTVVEGFAADLGMARETFAREVDNWLTGASDRFASSLANSLKAASAQSASELGNILATIKKAASDVQARFEDITTAYEGFNKQHGRFRAEIKDAAITLHDWHEDAVRTEAKLLHEWTRQFASDFDRLGKELNKLIDKAGREVLDEIQSAAHDRAETATILKEIAHSLRNGATHQASQGKVENRPTKPGA